MGLIEEVCLGICFFINIIICFGIPIVYFVYILINKRQDIKFYFYGVLTFLISQVFLRIPLIKVILPKANWYVEMSSFYPLIYSLFLGITAGIFEEVARFIGFKIAIKKKVDYSNGIAFGMGHGGIEAIIFAGVVNIRNFIMIISLNVDKFNSNKFGVSEDVIRNMFSRINSIQIFLAGIERISAISIHVGLSLLVLYGIKKRRKVYLLIAILIHGIIDSLIGVFSNLSFNIYFIECWCIICAIILGIFIVKSKKLFREGEFKHEKII